jgi:hypothetical protein
VLMASRAEHGPVITPSAGWRSGGAAFSTA